MKKHTKILAIALAGTMVLSMAACSASKSSKSNSDRQASNAKADADYDPEYYAAETMATEPYAGADYEEGIRSADINDYVGSEVSSKNSITNANQNTVTGTDPQLVGTDTMLIKRVSINAETTDFNSVTSTIEAKVAELGGYIESSNASGTGKNGDLRRVNYVIRVPLDKLDTLVNTVGTSVTVLSSNENTEDVTLQYSDIQSRIESLRVEQQTLNTLLAQADSLEAIITLQGRLTEVRYEIESNESRARVLKNQATYSTLTLNISEVLEETVQIETKKKTFGEEIWEGFVDSLGDLKDNGKSFVIGLVAAVPYIIIIAMLALIVLIIVKCSIRSYKKKKVVKAEAVSVDVSVKASDNDAKAEESDKKETKKE